MKAYCFKTVFPLMIINLHVEKLLLFLYGVASPMHSHMIEHLVNMIQN